MKLYKMNFFLKNIKDLTNQTDPFGEYSVGLVSKLIFSHLSYFILVSVYFMVLQ